MLGSDIGMSISSMYVYDTTIPMDIRSGLDKVNVYDYHFLVDSLTQGVSIIIYGFTGLLILMGYTEVVKSKISPARYFLLMLICILGLTLMIASTDLISLFISLELIGLSSYLLAGIGSDERSSEAGFKYFIMGVLTSCFYLLGSAVVYATAGSINFVDIGLYLANVVGPYEVVIKLGLVIILGVLLFKMGAAPFHVWVPDVYQGSPLSVTMFFAIIPKISILAVIAKLFLYHFVSMFDLTGNLLWIIAVIGLIITPYLALQQVSFLRFIAFSAVNHIAFLIMGLCVGTVESVQFVLLYTVIYMISLLGLFVIHIYLRNFAYEIQLSYIYELAGLFDSHKLLSLSLGIILFSLAGIPPLAGFFTKVFILSAAMDKELYLLSLIAVLSSVLSAVYYLYIIKVMFFDEALYVTRIRMSFFAKLSVLMVVVLLVGFFLFPIPFFKFIYYMTYSLM